MRKIASIAIVVMFVGPFVSHAAPDAVSAAALDAVAKKIIAREHVVGASVLLARGGQGILHKGYGFADPGLEAPAKDETVSHVVGPILPFTGVPLIHTVHPAHPPLH